MHNTTNNICLLLTDQPSRYSTPSPPLSYCVLNGTQPGLTKEQETQNTLSQWNNHGDQVLFVLAQAKANRVTYGTIFRIYTSKPA